MITYQIDRDKKYLDELLVHLRAHNKSFTGPKVKESAYIYVLKNDQLLGGALLHYSWDWVSFNNVFYKDLDVLRELIYKATSLYNEKAVGYNLYTKDDKLKDDFLSFGFTLDTTLHMSTDRGHTYCVIGHNINVESLQKFHTISSKECVNEYDIIQKEEQERYKKKHNIKGIQEELHYVALDGDTFAGGVNIQIYTDSLYVNLLAVNKDYKGKGIGTKLMTFVEDYAKEHNFESMDLGTTEFQARPFYEKLGYEVIRTQKDLPKGFECYTLIKRLK